MNLQIYWCKTIEEGIIISLTEARNFCGIARRRDIFFLEALGRFGDGEKKREGEGRDGNRDRAVRRKCSRQKATLDHHVTK